MWVDKTCEVSWIVCRRTSRRLASIDKLAETRQECILTYGLQPVSEYDG